MMVERLERRREKEDAADKTGDEPEDDHDDKLNMNILTTYHKY